MMILNLTNNENLNEITTLPPQRGGQGKARAAASGVLLDKMIKAIGRRMSIFVAERNLRPHELVQAAKFSSKASVIVRSQLQGTD